MNKNLTKENKKEPKTSQKLPPNPNSIPLNTTNTFQVFPSTNSNPLKASYHPVGGRYYVKYDINGKEIPFNTIDYINGVDYFK